MSTANTITAIGANNVLLTSGKTLWFGAATIIKFNDASGFEMGQTLEFKAWLNPDGSLIGIKRSKERKRGTEGLSSIPASPRYPWKSGNRAQSCSMPGAG